MKTNSTSIDYKGYLIASKTVLLAKEENDEEFTVSETKTAYQILDPASGYIYSTVSTVERARTMIDKHGERWRN